MQFIDKIALYRFCDNFIYQLPHGDPREVFFCNDLVQNTSTVQNFLIWKVDDNFQVELNSYLVYYSRRLSGELSSIVESSSTDHSSQVSSHA